jgi:hypothetical protein
MTVHRDVLAVVTARAEALAGQDWSVVDGQLHPDFVYTNSRGEQLSRSDYLDFLRDGPLRWRRQSLESPLVRVVGDVAVLAAVVVDDLLVDGEPLVLRFATTQTYVRDDGAWRYLAGQTSPIS